MKSKKLGGLKEKSLPSHGRSVSVDAGQRFTQLPKAARGEQKEGRGKVLSPKDHDMSVNKMMQDMRSQLSEHGKRSKADIGDDSKIVDKVLKGMKGKL